MDALRAFSHPRTKVHNLQIGRVLIFIKPRGNGVNSGLHYRPLLQALLSRYFELFCWNDRVPLAKFAITNHQTFCFGTKCKYHPISIQRLCSLFGAMKRSQYIHRRVVHLNFILAKFSPKGGQFLVVTALLLQHFILDNRYNRYICLQQNLAGALFQSKVIISPNECISLKECVSGLTD